MRVALRVHKDLRQFPILQLLSKRVARLKCKTRRIAGITMETFVLSYPMQENLTELLTTSLILVRHHLRPLITIY